MHVLDADALVIHLTLPPKSESLNWVENQVKEKANGKVKKSAVHAGIQA
jgi:hypothetical protein